MTPEGHDIFTDPALRQTINDDPVFRFFQRHWRQVLLLVGCVAALVYAQQVFRDTRVADLERSADIFNRARAEYEQILGLEVQLADARNKLGDKKDDAKKGTTESDPKAVDPAEGRVTELERQLGEAQRRIEGHLGSLVDARSPYQELGGLYKGLLARGSAAPEKRVAEMRAALGVASGSVALGEKPDLATELRAIALARTLIDGVETRNEGIEALSELATKGVYTRVSAGVALAHIASSPAERESALSILEGILAAQPEQESFVGPEIARLKASK